MAYLHKSTIEKQAIIHRDLRLSNLLIQEDTLSLIDFGLARFADPKYGSVCLDTPEIKEELEILSFKGQVFRKPGIFTYKLLRKAISPQSDLFGTGVIAIDLLGSQITDEKLFDQAWQTVLPLTTPFGNFLEKLLSRRDNFQSAEEASLALLTLQ
jgi:serine/threonine-protein kinase